MQQPRHALLPAAAGRRPPGVPRCQAGMPLLQLATGSYEEYLPFISDAVTLSASTLGTCIPVPADRCSVPGAPVQALVLS